MQNTCTRCIVLTTSSNCGNSLNVTYSLSLADGAWVTQIFFKKNVLGIRLLRVKILSSAAIVVEMDDAYSVHIHEKPL